MAAVRRFAINLVRAITDNKKPAGWDVRFLASILGIPNR